MFTGLWQLTRVTLRTDARSLGPHFTRFGLAALLLWVIAMTGTEGVSAPGLRLFRSQLVLAHLFLTANALFGFSLIIIEEREAGTLELLRLAGINSLSVLLGRLMPRLADAALLLAIQFPFTLLEITLGGITMHQVLAAYIALAAYLWLTAMIGLWFSVCARTQWSAVTSTAIALSVYNLPYLVNWVGGLFTISTSSWERVCLPLRLWSIADVSFAESAWSEAAVWAVIVGMLFGLAAWWQMERSLVSAVAPTQTRRNTTRPKRVWNRPLVWKEYRFLMGGLWGIAIRSALYLGLLVWMIAEHQEIGMALAWTALLGGALSLIDGTWTASRLFSEEKRNQTWSVLALTPLSMFQLSSAKWAGWLLGHAPSILIPYACIVLCPIVHPHFKSSGATVELFIGSIGTGLAIIATMHLLAINSLSWGWKAIPLTLTICCLGAYVFLYSMFPWRESIGMRNVYHAMTAGFMFALIIAMQARLVHLLGKLAGEDA
ncbi:MAG: hypothetical protein KDA58_13695 [Planctomycetaceae bacterium]|nr:hypothetical protein [Planctomycetaceae bacterium]